jgi:hypothetical protein
VRRQAKASSAGSTLGTGSVRGLRRRALATRGASSGSRGSGAPAIGLAVALVVAFLVFAAVASAQTTNQYLSQISRGASPQADAAPTVVAASSTGEVYVAIGSQPSVVEHYDAAGTYVGTFDPTSTPQGSLPFPAGLAVAPDGDVYVADQVNGVIDRFSSSGTYLSQVDGSGTPEGSFGPAQIAVGPDGHLFVAAGNVVDVFDASGAYLGQFDGSATPQGSFCAGNLVVAPSGDIYVSDPCSGVVDHFDSSDNYLGQIEGSVTPGGFFSLVGLAVGSTGDVYVADAANGVVDVFDASGAYVGQFDGSNTPQGSLSLSQEFSVPSALSAGPGQTLYLARTGASQIDKFSEARVVIPDVTTEPAAALDQTVATLNGTVNPDEVQLTDCHFEVVPASQFEADGYASVTPAEQTPCVPDAATIAADGNDHPVTAELTGLQPNTTYHFRLLAGNANGTTHTLDETFTTLAPPSLSGETAANNTPTEVDLDATINPNGTDTSYRFEYGLDTSYGTTLPVPDADIGAERADQAVSVHVAGLLPETTYHYRVIAHSTVGTTESGDLTFRTAGGLFPLPDNRAWEQVSPVNKRGTGIEGIENVAADGNAVTFNVQAGLGGAETLRSVNEYLARRTETGWVTSPLALPQRLGANGGAAGSPLAISSNLTKVLLSSGLQKPGAPPVSVAPVTGATQLFIETLSSDPLAPPTYAPVGPILQDVTGNPQQPFAEYMGGAPDLSTLVFTSAQPLTPGPPGKAVYELSEIGRGVNSPLRRIDVDNSGAPMGGVQTIADGFNTVSNDGSRVFFDDVDGRVYTRTGDVTTTAVSDPSPSECQPSCLHPAFQSAHFAGASEDGTLAYFVTAQELVATDTDNTPDLYEYDFSAPAGHHLTLISGGGSGDATPGSGADVLGMMRLSDNGSRAAFVAQGVLTTIPNASGSQAVADADNLYVVNGQAGGAAAVKFVGTVADSDASLWDPTDLERRAQMSSPDGRYLVFSTHAQLTADDTDSAEDVYLFDDESGGLTRVSHGHEGFNEDGNGPAGASIPAPKFIAGGALGAMFQTGRLRAVSDDGSTITFNTEGSLQQVDQNRKPNVYEWHEGEVALIGDPQDPSNRAGSLVAATGVLSRSGSDLFTLSASPLVPQDTDGTVRDVYDARVGGGFPFVTPTACNALVEGCQPPPSLPPLPSLSATDNPNPGGNRPTVLSLGKVGASAVSKFARTGRLTLRVTGPGGDILMVRARTRIGGKTKAIGSSSHRLASAGTASIPLQISKAARQQLAEMGKLVVKIVVTDAGAGTSRSLTLRLMSPRPSHKNRGGRS